MRWKATFSGKLKNAIGITCGIIDHVNTGDEKKARIKLYDKYEHISGLNLEKL